MVMVNAGASKTWGVAQILIFKMLSVWLMFDPKLFFMILTKLTA
jgi:hypothetical protein